MHASVMQQFKVDLEGLKCGFLVFYRIEGGTNENQAIGRDMCCTTSWGEFVRLNYVFLMFYLWFLL